MRDRLRVLVLNEPVPVNGVTWWRMYRPLSLLAKQYPDLQITWNRGQILPSDLMNADVVIAMHVSNAAQVAVLQAAQNEGCRIILDYDDDLINIPVQHGAYASVGQARQHVQEALNLADTVWVTTTALGVATKRPDFVLIPNAVLEEDLVGVPNKMNNRMAWRGSVMAFYDLWKREPEFLEYLEKCNNFVWMGYQPPYTIPPKHRQKVSFYPWRNSIGSYFDVLNRCMINVIWKPMENILFNDSKSNIAYLEATCAGAVCLTDEWRVATQSQWAHCLSKLTFDEDYIRDLWELSRNDVVSNYNLNHVNHLRYLSLMGAELLKKI